MRLVIDTSVLIDHLRGRPSEAKDLVPEALARGDELWSSEVVKAELLAGMRSDEETETRRLMALINWVGVDDALAEAAGVLGRRYLRSHQGIEITDLLIAALVQRLDAQLRTRNVKHYPMFEGLEPPY